MPGSWSQVRSGVSEAGAGAAARSRLSAAPARRGTLRSPCVGATVTTLVSPPRRLAWQLRSPTSRSYSTPRTTWPSPSGRSRRGPRSRKPGAPPYGRRTARTPLEAPGGARIEARQDIRPGHKIARRARAAGDTVRRYGQVIGFATEAIAVGDPGPTQNPGIGELAAGRY